MLYGNQSISHYSPGNVTIWMIMAFQAGLLNIGGFLAGHKIVSHVTGFATFYGDEISKGSGNASSMLIVPVFFLLGAMISGYFVDIRLKLKKKPKYYITFAFMFILTSLIWFWALWMFLAPFQKEPIKFRIIFFFCSFAWSAAFKMPRSQLFPNLS